jgi:hypothetical protein
MAASVAIFFVINDLFSCQETVEIGTAGQPFDPIRNSNGPSTAPFPLKWTGTQIATVPMRHDDASP